MFITKPQGQLIELESHTDKYINITFSLQLLPFFKIKIITKLIYFNLGMIIYIKAVKIVIEYRNCF